MQNKSRGEKYGRTTEITLFVVSNTLSFVEYNYQLTHNSQFRVSAKSHFLHFFNNNLVPQHYKLLRTHCINWYKPTLLNVWIEFYIKSNPSFSSILEVVSVTVLFGNWALWKGSWWNYRYSLPPYKTVF